MNIFNKLQGQYESLWKHIIRPTRTAYPESALGPQTFYLQNKKVKRVDFQLINPRGLVFYGSHFIPLQQQSYPCVIYLHGNSSNRTQGMEYLGELIRRNISLCTFDFSGCGNSQGQYVTLGYYQWEDLHEVVEWIRHKQKITKIGIWGRSMGAVTALLYLKRSQHVKVGVFDSPFKSLKSLVEDLVHNNSKIPGFIVKGALKIISGTIQQKANFDIYKLNPLKYEVPFLQFPAFFIVGRDDQLIPYTHTEELFKAYKGTEKEIRIEPGTHNQERPESCIQEAIKFLEKYLKEDSMKEWEPKVIIEQKKQQIANEIDFFADETSFPQTKIAANIQNYLYESNNVDFFDIKIQQSPKIPPKQSKQEHHKQQSKQTNTSSSFSFSSMISNAINKVKSINFYSPSQPLAQNLKLHKLDGYEQLRAIVQNKFIAEESDLREKSKMRKVNNLAKLKQYQNEYKNQNENSDKLQSLIFK